MKEEKEEKKYTKEDLEKNSKRYRRNFKKLYATIGTPDHKIYVNRESKLNKLDIRIRKDLNIYY